MPLDESVVKSEAGHSAAHAELRTAYLARGNASLPVYTGYSDATHAEIHNKLHDEHNKLGGVSLPTNYTASSTTGHPAAHSILHAAHNARLEGTGGSGGPLTDRLNVTYTDPAGTQSKYHIFAAGLNWSKKVGLMVYCDGSGEFGLYNPSSTYLLAGATNGMIAVAKRHNMVLLTPMAPDDGNGCDDGDGVCWYDESGPITKPQKNNWSFALVKLIQSQYNIHKSRVALGGYSSGAQWTSEFFGPAYASQIMTDGVMVPISYGGAPKPTQSGVPTNYPASFKAAVPVAWDCGDQDPAYLGTAGATEGYNWYTNNGFAVTRLTVVPGKGHNRNAGEFGQIMDREIVRYVIPA